MQPRGSNVALMHECWDKIQPNNARRALLGLNFVPTLYIRATFDPRSVACRFLLQRHDAHIVATKFFCPKIFCCYNGSYSNKIFFEILTKKILLQQRLIQQQNFFSKFFKYIGYNITYKLDFTWNMVKLINYFNFSYIIYDNIYFNIILYIPYNIYHILYMVFMSKIVKIWKNSGKSSGIFSFYARYIGKILVET